MRSENSDTPARVITREKVWHGGELHLNVNAKDVKVAVYETLVATNATTLTDINTDKLKLIKAWNTLDEDSRAILVKTVKLLFKENIKQYKKKK